MDACSHSCLHLLRLNRNIGAEDPSPLHAWDEDDDDDDELPEDPPSSDDDEHEEGVPHTPDSPPPESDTTRLSRVHRAPPPVGRPVGSTGGISNAGSAPIRSAPPPLPHHSVAAVRTSSDGDSASPKPLGSPRVESERPIPQESPASSFTDTVSVHTTSGATTTPHVVGASPQVALTRINTDDHRGGVAGVAMADIDSLQHKGSSKGGLSRRGPSTTTDGSPSATHVAASPAVGSSLSGSPRASSRVLSKASAGGLLWITFSCVALLLASV